MAVPENGPLHLGKIAKEFVYDNYDSVSTQPTNVSLKNLSTHTADGGFDAVNTSSFHKPDGAVVHGMSEFYEYDHDYSSNPSYVSYTLKYSTSTSSVCTASSVTVYCDWFQDFYKTDPVKSALDIHSNTSLTTNRAAGWYSNGTEKRYWTGSSWYGIQNCGSSSDPDSTTNEAFTLNVDPYQPYSSTFEHVRKYEISGSYLKARGDSLTDKYYRFNLKNAGVGDHSLIVDTQEYVYTGGGIYNSDDRNHKPAIGLTDKYGTAGIFSSSETGLNDVYGPAKQIATVWNWNDNTNNIISDMCWIDIPATPTHIFWVDTKPADVYINNFLDYFRFGAVKNALQTKSSIYHPQLFLFEHFAKKFEKNPLQTQPLKFTSRYAKPSVASAYANSASNCYIAGQVFDDYARYTTKKYHPFLYKIQFSSQTAANATSSNVWSNSTPKVWTINSASTQYTAFRDVAANSTNVVAVGNVTTLISSENKNRGAALITTPTLVYSKHLIFGDDHTVAHGVAINGSDSYICGITGTSAGTSQYKSFLIKTNGSSLTWRKIYKLNLFGTGENSESYVWKQIALDSSNNIYVATQQEFRKTDFVPNDIFYDSGHMDQKDYAGGDSLVGTDTDDFRIAIAKFNSSGTLQWIKRININGSTDGNWPGYAKCKGISSLYAQGDYIYAGFSFDMDIGINAGHDYFKIRASDGDISTGALGSGFTVTSATMSSGTALNTYTDYSSDSFSFNSYTNGSGNLQSVAQSAVMQLSEIDGNISDSSPGEQWGYYGITSKTS